MNQRNKKNIGKLASSPNNELTRLTHAFKRNSGNVKSWLDLADLYHQQGDYEQAIALLNETKQAFFASKFRLNQVDRILTLDKIYRGLSEIYAQKNPTQLNLALENLNLAVDLILENNHLFLNSKALLIRNYRELGALALKNSQPIEAIEYLNKSLALLNDADIDDRKIKIEHYEERAGVYMFCKDAVRASLDLQYALNLCLLNKEQFSIKIIHLYYNIGIINEGEKNIMGASECFDAAIAEFLRTNCNIDHGLLATIYYECLLMHFILQNHEQCVEYSNQALSLYNNSPVNKGNIYRILSSSHFNQAEYDSAFHFAKEAFCVFEPLKDSHPFEFAESCFLYIQGFFTDYPFDEALFYSDKAMEFYQIAQKSKNLNKVMDEKITEHRLQIVPNITANMLLVKERYDDAIKYYKICLNHEASKTGDNYYLYGLSIKRAYERANNFQGNKIDAVIDNYVKAIKKYIEDKSEVNDLKFAIVSRDLGYIYLLKKQFKAAAKHFNNAFLKMDAMIDCIYTAVFNDVLLIKLTKKDNSLHYHLCLATIHFQENNPAEAIKHYNAILNEAIFHKPEHYENYAQCCIALNKPFDAIIYYELSLREFPLSSRKDEVLCALGQLYFDQENFVAAKDMFLLTLSPSVRLDATLEQKIIDNLQFILDHNASLSSSSENEFAIRAGVVFRNIIHKHLFNFYIQKDSPNYALAGNHLAEMAFPGQKKHWKLTRFLAENYQKLANLKMNIHQYADAIADLSRALKLLETGLLEESDVKICRTIKISFYEDRIRAYAIVSERENVLADLHCLLTEYFNDKEHFSLKIGPTYIEIGRLYAQKGDWINAVEAFQSALSESQHTPAVLTSPIRQEIAQAFLHMADCSFDDENALNSYSYYTFAGNEGLSFTLQQYKNHALVCIKMNKPIEAIKCYNQALEQIGNTHSGRFFSAGASEAEKDLAFRLGSLYLTQSDLVNAGKHFLAALKKSTSEIELVSNKERESYSHLYLGEIFSRQHNFHKAERHYMIALNNSALRTAAIYFKVGNFFYEHKKYTTAERYLKLVLSMEGGHSIDNELSQMMLEEINQRHLKVMLPLQIKTLFQELSELYPNVYLRGSVIHLLLNAEPMSNERDIDFFVIGETSNRLNEDLDFNTCPFNGYLYQKTTEEGISVDCFVKSPGLDSNAAFSADFTITSLYCDKYGIIRDPSERGLEDFYARRLDLVNQKSPVEVLQADPVILLRAIKYKMRGYQFSAKLQQAINDYIHLIDPVKNEHILAVMKKMLRADKVQNQAFVAHLGAERLLEKLFGISNSAPIEDVLWQLKNKIQKSPVSQRMQSIPAFSRTPSPGNSAI